MPIFTPDNTQPLYEGSEVDPFSVSVSIAPDDVAGETSAVFTSASINTNESSVSLVVSSTSFTVAYDGTGLFPIQYVKYELDGTTDTLNTVYSLTDLPPNAMELIAVKKDPVSPKIFTVLANWETDLSNGSIGYDIIIHGEYTVIKNWVVAEVDKRR